MKEQCKRKRREGREKRERKRKGEEATKMGKWDQTQREHKIEGRGSKKLVGREGTAQDREYCTHWKGGAKNYKYFFGNEK